MEERKRKVESYRNAIELTTGKKHLRFPTIKVWFHLRSEYPNSFESFLLTERKL